MTISSNKPNTAFWIIGALALLWNLMGVYQYLMQAFKTESWAAQYTSDQLAMIERLPSWYIAIFAIAVFASAIGCILLLLRKKWAITSFLIGFVAVVIQSGYNLFVNEARTDYDTFQYSMIISIPLIAALLWWYSTICNKKGWLS